MFCSKIKLKEIEMKKKLILDEAKKIIHKVGFKHAKMKDIAEKVGFSKASLYSYFKDKDEIAMSLFKTHLEKMYDKLKTLPEEEISALEKFEKIRNVHLTFLKEGKNLMLVKPHVKKLEGVHLEVFSLKNQCFEVLRKIIRQGIKEGCFRSDIDVDQVMTILDSLMAGIVFQASMLNNIKSDLVNHYEIDNMIKKGLDFFLLALTNTNGADIK